MYANFNHKPSLTSGDIIPKSVLVLPLVDAPVVFEFDEAL